MTLDASDPPRPPRTFAGQPLWTRGDLWGSALLLAAGLGFWFAGSPHQRWLQIAAAVGAGCLMRALSRARRLEVGDDGLCVRGWLMPAVVWPWAEVGGAGLDGADLVVHCSGGTYRLAGLDSPAAAARLIRSYLDPSTPVGTGDQVPAEQVAAWLGVAVDGRVICRPKFPWLALLLRLALVVALIAVGLPIWVSGREAALAIVAVLFGLSVGTLGLLRNALLDRRREVRADVYGLRVRRGRRWTDVAWRDLIGIDLGPRHDRYVRWGHSDKQPEFEWQVTHRDGAFGFATADEHAERLHAAISQAIEASERGDLLPAGLDAGEAALSLARLDGEPASERGLSLAERDGESA